MNIFLYTSEQRATKKCVLWKMWIIVNAPSLFSGAALLERIQCYHG